MIDPPLGSDPQLDLGALLGGTKPAGAFEPGHSPDRVERILSRARAVTAADDLLVFGLTRFWAVLLNVAAVFASVLLRHEAAIRASTQVPVSESDVSGQKKGPPHES